MAFKPPRPGGPQRRPLSPSEKRKKKREYDRKRREDRERSKSLKPSAARVALRYAARIAPPSMMGSATMLKRQGLTPVEVYLDSEGQPTVVQPWRSGPVVELGAMVQNRRGDLLYFAGVAPDGSAILGKTEQEAQRLNKKVIEDRKRFPPRTASGSPLMLQPDYGHGAGLPKQASDDPKTYDITLTVSVTVPEDYDENDRGDAAEIARIAKDKMTSFLRGAKLRDFEVGGPEWHDDDAETKRPASKRKASLAVPGDEEYHPCQHGGECQCGGQCGCGKKAAAVRKMMAASPKGIKDLKPNKWYISTEDGDTYGPYPNESKAKSDGKAAFGGSTDYIVEKGGTIGASVLNPRRFGLFTPEELVK